ncbi:MAG: peptide deformylase [Candidatus Magasanikbacteria bacterium]|jgi:peptide deformylase|nr:peptide deformylase [Candidatus Magasanikbacteria bacterium]
MVLPVLQAPDERLRKRSQEIDQKIIASPDMQQFFDNMIATMHADDGIGIAAPQIGKQLRAFSVGIEALKRFKVYTGSLPVDQELVLINPVWEKTTKKTLWDTEGCLSVPNTYGKVKRFGSIRVSALKRDGEKIEFEAKGYFARVIQHETDHLDGILFIDKAVDIVSSKP